MRDGIQREIREAITRADALSRQAHDERIDPLAGRLDALRTVLVQVDEHVGAEPGTQSGWLDLIVEARGVIQEIASFSSYMSPQLRGALDDFLASARALPIAIERFADASGAFAGTFAERLLALPPDVDAPAQAVHTVVDYAAAATALSLVPFCSTDRARYSSAILGGVLGATGVVSHLRLRSGRPLPLVVHDVLAIGWAASIFVAPFVLGFGKKDRGPKAVHVALGLGALAVTAFGHVVQRRQR